MYAILNSCDFQSFEINLYIAMVDVKFPLSYLRDINISKYNVIGDFYNSNSEFDIPNALYVNFIKSCSI